MLAEPSLAISQKRDGLSERGIDARQFQGQFANLFGGKRQNGRKAGGGGGQKGGKKGGAAAGGAAAGAAGGAAAGAAGGKGAATTAAPPAAATPPAAANNNVCLFLAWLYFQPESDFTPDWLQKDAQKSLTLLASQVQTNLANDGQNVPAAGQVPSLTSTNNLWVHSSVCFQQMC